MTSKDDVKRLVELLQIPQESRRAEDIGEMLGLLVKYDWMKRNLGQLNEVLKNQFCRALKIERLRFKEIVYNIGDAPSKVYVILKGSVELFTKDEQGELIFVRKLGVQRQIGEREIIRNIPREYTVIAQENVNWLMTLQADDFNRLLSDLVQAELAQKVNFISKYIPHLHNYSQVHKERIAYSIKLENFKRNDIILQKDNLTERLYFITDGQCAILKDAGSRQVPLLQMGIGSCFGEECVLKGQRAM